MNLALPQITRLIDELEERNYITRQVEIADRRKFKILLGDEGKLLAQKLNKTLAFSSPLDDSSLSDEELALYKCISTYCLSN